MASRRVAGGAVSDLCYKKAGYAQFSVYPLLAQQHLDARQQEVFGGSTRSLGAELNAGLT